MLSTPVRGGRAARHQGVVVGEFDGLGGRVVLPDAVVALRGEPAGAVRVVAALAAVEALGAGDLVAGGGGAGRVRDPRPAHRAARAAAPDQHLQRARRQVAPGRRTEPVEAAVRHVLGQVDHPADRVGGRRLVLEAAHRVTADRRLHAPGVGLVDVAPVHLLAGQPSVPRGLPARAVLPGAGQDAVRARDGAGGRELHRARAARGVDLRVGDVDPARSVRVAGAAVGGGVPGVRGARDLPAGTGDHPAGEPGRKPDPVRVRRAERSVGAGAGLGGGGVRGAAPQGSAEDGGRAADGGGTQEGTTFHSRSKRCRDRPAAGRRRELRWGT